MQQDQTKKALQSKTIKGAISEMVSTAALVGVFFGLDLDGETQAGITNNLNALCVAVLALWQTVNQLIVVYGRMTAKTTIAKKGQA